ncbi:MAG: putative manganese transporter [Eubacteriales bacterium]
MQVFFDCLLDALLDALRVLPILLIVYLLIEWVEYKNYVKAGRTLLLQGKLSPLFGALLGSVPQCGFSVASTELFAKGTLSAGALAAVYIATSDEAIPILLSHPDRYVDLALLVGIKIVLALAVGYPVLLLWKKRVPAAGVDETSGHGDHRDPHGHDEHPDHDDCDDHDGHAQEHHGPIGCCHHDVEGDGHFEWKHPLIHCLKIILYLFLINLAMSLLVAWVGEDTLVNFLGKSLWLQPILALLVGLIPNCASSVVLTEFYLLGGLTLGSVVAGLTVNAGLGFMVLYKENKNLRENIALTAIVVLAGLAAGYVINGVIGIL